VSNDTRDPFGPDVRVCGLHELRMRNAIKERGLWERVSVTPRHLAERLKRRDTFDIDPLMLLHNMVFGKAKHTAAMNGVELVRQCPVCYFGVEHWIDEAAAAVAVRLARLDEEKLADQQRNRELEEAARS
jgi:hypothetical protein